MTDLFRKEAVDHHAGRGGIGDVLRLAPSWLDRVFWLLLVLVAVGIALTVVVHVDGDPLLWVLLGRG